ncbi:MAG: dimethyl sulfoxide reductase anchor subunit [Nitrospinota bacterium]|nr:dimethyl sulfoxide reductase anchor subunit [Nitrospinota bacterium]
MRPEYSLILLTVLAGAGQGLFLFLATGDMAGFSKGSRLPPMTTLTGLGVALALTLAGMAASFFPLTHKARGVKAINKWRHSWLSREVILLPVFVGGMVFYGLLYFIGVHPAIIQATGVAGIFVVLALFISTAMIYGHLTIIREWGTAYTPANFTLTGMITGWASGAAVYQMGLAPVGATLFNLRLFFLLAVAGLIVKLLYYHRNSRLYSPTTIQTALGIGHRKIRLMDTGSAYPTYNTEEYHYTALKEKRGILKVASIILLYILPMAGLAWDYMALFSGGEGCLAPVAAISAMGGAFIERWVFFVEGNHAQNLYYGNFPVEARPNPILQSGKKDAPLPPA